MVTWSTSYDMTFMCIYMCKIYLYILFQRVTEYFELEGSHKDHEVQLLSEWPKWGSNPQPCHYYALTNWSNYNYVIDTCSSRLLIVVTKLKYIYSFKDVYY